MRHTKQFWELEFSDRNRRKDEFLYDFRQRMLCFDPHKKCWVRRPEYTGSMYPATFPCRSYRAALRHLRKHDEIPRGTIFRLVSKFIGCDRFIVKK